MPDPPRAADELGGERQALAVEAGRERQGRQAGVRPGRAERRVAGAAAERRRRSGRDGERSASNVASHGPTASRNAARSRWAAAMARSSWRRPASISSAIRGGYSAACCPNHARCWAAASASRTSWPAATTGRTGTGSGSSTIVAPAAASAATTSVEMGRGARAPPGRGAPAGPRAAAVARGSRDRATGQDALHERRVGDGPGERPGVVEGRAERQDAVERHVAVVALQPDDAAERRGPQDRADRLRPDRDRHVTSRDRGRRSRRGAAGRVVERPRVAGRRPGRGRRTASRRSCRR